MSLWQSLRIVSRLSLTFVFFGGLIVLLRGGVYDFRYIPGFFRGVIAVVILIPVIQWIRPWFDRASPQGETSKMSFVLMFLGIIPFAGLIQLADHFWPRLFAEVGLPLQVTLLMVLVLASQWIYYRLVKNHYQQADLI